MLARLKRLFERPIRSTVNRDDRFLAELIEPRTAESSVSAISELDRLLTDLAGDAKQTPPDFPGHIVDPESLSPEQLRSEADRILDLRFTLAAEPEVKFEGGVDWSFDPTSDPRRRWCRELHRHRWVATLAAAYQITGDESYAARLVDLLTDWINSNPPPVRKNESDVVWTLMGVGMRAAVWPSAFYRLLNSPSFNRKAQTLMLASIHDHGNFLYRFKTHANHLLRETNGLLALAGYFPFFKAASEWQTRALERYSEEISKQVYPDGCHVEMSSGYQWMVAEEFEAVDRLLSQFGWLLPGTDLRGALQRMYGVLVHTARPDGSWPQLGDGFLDTPEELRQRMLAAGRHLERPDLSFVASSGKEGTPPQVRSICFSQGAFTVMRSDWSKTADWLLFRAGPFGGAHGHEDKLSIEVSARGRPLLIDPGTYTYHAQDPFRTYFVSSNAHNTIVVDGMSQTRRWDTAHRAPTGHTGEQMQFVSGSSFSWAAGDYDQGYAPYQFTVPAHPKIATGIHHRREVLWIDETYWLVVDQLDAKTAHRFSRVFQATPDAITHSFATGVGLETQDQNASLLLLNPIEDQITIDTVAGEEPNGSRVSGWACNGLRGHKTPAPGITLHHDAHGPAVLLTLLVPGDGISAAKVPVFHRLALTEGNGIALTIEFQDRCDTLIVSTNTARKRFGLLDSTARIAAWRSRPGSDQQTLLFELATPDAAGVVDDRH